MHWHRHPGWHPRDLAWRTPVLFMVGSVLFAVGSFPVTWALVDARVVALTFVVGAVFFTTAAGHQYVQVADGRPGDALRLRTWRSHGAPWWAAVVQLAGTLLFNVNTIAATATHLTTHQENRLVWAPDLFGSIAFLAASQLGWLAVRGRAGSGRRDDPEWWSAVLNYLGSVFFMASAVAAFTLPTTGEPVNLTIVNAGTFLGAVCFFVGAWVLLPEPAGG